MLDKSRGWYRNPGDRRQHGHWDGEGGQTTQPAGP
jgi:hypothetical protein